MLGNDEICDVLMAGCQRRLGSLTIVAPLGLQYLSKYTIQARLVIRSAALG